ADDGETLLEACDLHRPALHGPVGLDDIGIVAVGSLLHGGGGHRDRSLAGIEDQPRVDELPGQSSALSLSVVAFRWIVAVVVATWLSIRVSFPWSSTSRALASKAWTASGVWSCLRRISTR